MAATASGKFSYVIRFESGVWIDNARRQPPLPVACALPGAKRPTTGRDAGRGWRNGMVRD